jgi:CYTH domain-containing protein
VSVEILDGLLAHLSPLIAGGEFDDLRRQLVERFEDISARHLSEERRQERVAAALEGSAGRIDFWPIGEDRFETIAPGLRRVYREGRKRRDEAYDEPSFERFHEWRKQVKYLDAQVSILETMVPRLLRPLAEALERISDLVGESTDLAELARLLQDDEGPAMEEPRRRALLELIEARRAELRALAHPLAEFAWRDEPDRFVERLATCWEAWRREIPPRDAGRSGLEIERKFLVLGDPRGPSTEIRQGYLAVDDPEVRIRLGGDGAWLTVKSAANPPAGPSHAEPAPLSRSEIEIPVAAEQAERLYEACPWKLRKTRYLNGRWEVDAFDEPRRFLLAEVEVSSADEPLPTPPAWLRIVREVTGDPDYENRNLARGPGRSAAGDDPGGREAPADPFELLERMFSDVERVIFGRDGA